MPKEQTSLTNLSRLIYFAALAMFTASLFLPAFITENNDIYGYWVLALGWLGFISFQFAWYAAPLGIIVIYYSRTTPQLALLLAVIAILLASETFIFTEIPFGQGDKIIDFGLGFYVWYSSFFLVAFGTLLQLVAWGNVHEEAFPQTRSRTVATEQDPLNTRQKLIQHRTTSRVEKKVVKKNPISNSVEDRSRKANKWQRSAPPPLPKRNIYAELPKKQPIDGAKRISQTPPPLPQRKKAVTSAKPPPLPVKPKAAKTSGLTLAPFFMKKSR